MMLEIKDVSKTYGQKQEGKALEHVSLRFEKGQFAAIVGKSGSGKTTLLNIIAGLTRPSAGSIEYGGENVTNKKAREISQFRKEHVGIILQNFSLLNDRNVYANVELPLRIRRVNKDKRETLVEGYLKLVGMEDKQSARPAQLSGGQKQRVAIARALIGDADIILADEPTGSLDEETAEQIIKILREIADSGKIVIMVTHDMNAAGKCDRCITLDSGVVRREVKGEKHE